MALRPASPLAAQRPRQTPKPSTEPASASRHRAAPGGFSVAAVPVGTALRSIRVTQTARTQYQYRGHGRDTVPIVHAEIVGWERVQGASGPWRGGECGPGETRGLAALLVSRSSC